ncbi:hypothetical protein OsJ_26238 [Oryza sativa Japonica Group]|uniref:Uncharacterized protein n=1 Tax=Oryza sativa subsp. japonica TaxID=39947 RepID=B9FZC2_ORYSJ|nr:hypothetical protein OsJ_26238 [Oryza sativa Japonica Group]
MYAIADHHHLPPISMSDDEQSSADILLMTCRPTISGRETLQNMYKILTLPQAARGLLALGDYCQRLRALSSLWAARPREPA